MSDDDSRFPPDGGWRKLSSEMVLATPWLRLRRDHIALPSGEEIDYHTLEHDGWAIVVPMLGDGQVLVERIYRWPLQAWPLELPAGGLDGDAPEVGARRELQEETGFVAGSMERLGCFTTTSGHSNERFHVFLAHDVRPEGERALEATEQIELLTLPLEALHAMVLRGELDDAPSALAILLTWEHLRQDE